MDRIALLESLKNLGEAQFKEVLYLAGFDDRYLRARASSPPSLHFSPRLAHMWQRYFAPNKSTRDTVVISTWDRVYSFRFGVDPAFRKRRHQRLLRHCQDEDVVQGARHVSRLRNRRFRVASGITPYGRAWFRARESR